MSYEPKFKLNRQDENRWRSLVAREPYALGPPRRGFSPLNMSERLELDVLQRKRRRKLHSRPAMAAQMRSSRTQLRRLRKLARQGEMNP